MEDVSRGYKVPLPFILISVLFISAIIIMTPLVTNVQEVNEVSLQIVIRDGLIYKQGNDSPYTGHVIDTLDKKIIEYDVVNGLKHGEFSISNLEGNFSCFGFVEQNKNVGNWKYFYDDGRLESTGDFIDDKPHGKWIWYFKNGKIKSEGNYLSGKPDGRWFKYDYQGHLNQVIYYSEGEIVSDIKFNIPRSI